MRFEQDLFIMMIVGFVLISVFLLSVFMKKRDKKELDADLETLLREEEEAKANAIPMNSITRTGNSGGAEVINVTFGIPVNTPDRNGNVVTKEAMLEALEGDHKDFSMGYVEPTNYTQTSEGNTIYHGFSKKKKKARVYKLGTLEDQWGCSFCPDKVYKHKSSAHKHIAKKHK